MTFKLRKAPLRLPRDSRGSLSIDYWGLTLLIAALYSILCLITPYLLDDYTFMGNWRDNIAGNMDFSWKAWLDFFNFTRSYDNARIANALSPFTTMFSPWKEMFPFLTGIVLALIMVYVQRVTSDRFSVGLLALTWALMIVGMPWRDTIFVRDYSLNYIWAAAVSLFLLFLMRRGETRGWTPWLLILSLITAIIAGGWHEGFAIPAICGLGLLAIMRRFRLSPQFFIILAVYTAAALIFFFASAVSRRAADAMATAQTYLSARFYIIDLLCLCLITVLAFSKNGRGTLKKTLSSSVGIVCIGIAAAGYGISFLTANTPRSIFWPNMGVIALTICIISHVEWQTLIGGHILRSTSRGVTTLLIILCTLQTLGVIYWQQIYSAETARIVALEEESESGTVFYDFTAPHHPPLYTLHIPTFNSWRNPFHTYMFWSFYMKPTFGVVPTALKKARLEDADPEEHPQWDAETRNYNGHIISPYRKLRPDQLKVPEYVEGALAIPFVTEYGDTLTYYLPQL